MIIFSVAVYVAGAHWTEPPQRRYLKWADWFATPIPLQMQAPK